MRAFPAPLLLAAPLLTAACGDSSPASPFSGAATLAAEAAGTSQSPIDIRTNRVTFVNPRDLPALDFRYGRDATLDIVNTGSPDEDATVRADVTAGGGELRVRGETFRLLQFHFHTPSEHLINGKHFPIEMHLVHQSAGGALMVVGVLVRQGQEEHRPLARIFGVLPKQEGEHAILTDFPLHRLLPDRAVSVRYSGSLTTPPFTEPVAWVVLKQPIAMSFEHRRVQGAVRGRELARGPAPARAEGRLRRRAASGEDGLTAGDPGRAGSASGGPGSDGW